MKLAGLARPFPLDKLLATESAAILDINETVAAIISDCKTNAHCRTQGPIDQERSGRGLFIDGHRGTGKSSVLLTLLTEWGGSTGSNASQAGLRRKLKFDELANNVHIIYPILDFDPLPKGLSLAGWLLQSWQEEANKWAKRDKQSSSDRQDLAELWTVLFEASVIGWSDTPLGEKGLIERALTSGDQSRAWNTLQRKWRDFICRLLTASADQDESNDALPGHSNVFVVPIDDADLEVDRLPELLHALRLLHHPNVIYLLTGDIEHLEHVLRTSLLEEHTKGLTAVRLEKSDEELAWARTHSRQIAESILQKTVPSVFHLKDLSLEDLLAFLRDQQISERGGRAPGQNRKGSKVATWRDRVVRFFEQVCSVPAVRALPTMPVRRLQRAVELYWFSSEDRSAEFLDTLLLGRDLPTDGVRLTTLRPNSVLRWAGFGEVEIAAMSQVREGSPRLALEYPDNRRQEGAAAIRAWLALVAQKANLLTGLEIGGLAWVPDAGMVLSETSPRSPDLHAVLHWPWILKPGVEEVVQASSSWAELAVGLQEQSDLPGRSAELLRLWALWNVDRLDRTLRNPPQAKSSRNARLPAIFSRLDASISDLEKDKERLVSIKNEGIDPVRDARLWKNEMAALTRPYYGISREGRRELEAALDAKSLRFAASEKPIEDGLLYSIVESKRRIPTDRELHSRVTSFLEYFAEEDDEDEADSSKGSAKSQRRKSPMRRPISRANR